MHDGNHAAVHAVFIWDAAAMLLPRKLGLRTPYVRSGGRLSAELVNRKEIPSEEVNLYARQKKKCITPD